MPFVSDLFKWEDWFHSSAYMDPEDIIWPRIQG